MRLTDIAGDALKSVTTTLNGLAAKIAREAALWGACAFCAVAAIIIATSASILALEPHVGGVYARLIVAGVYAAIVLIIVLSMRLSQPSRPKPATVKIDAHLETPPRNAQFAQIAMILEAVMLGFSMSRRSDRR